MVNLTPEVGYPEAGASNTRSAAGWYASPYPLSERFFLVSHTLDVAHNSRAGYGLYLLDAFGNRELLYRDAKLSCYSPIPLRPRRRPPVLPEEIAEDPHGTVVLTDVYRGLPGVARGAVKYLRILESLPKKVHSTPQRMDLGASCGWGPRVVLGTVPVEADGSARFRVPADRAIFFEALDERFLEVRRMRSFLTVRPGEEVSCIGCHEPYAEAPANRVPMATAGPVRPIDPPPWGVQPMDFRKVVQPVLTARCVGYHDGSIGEDKAFDLRGLKIVTAPSWGNRDQGPQHAVTDAFANLVKHVSYIRLGGFRGGELPLGVRATGSSRSYLVKILTQGHHDVKLTGHQWRALVAWIDCNAPFYGGWDDIVFAEPPPPRPPVLPAARTRAIVARRAELGRLAPKGSHLACYLDCGFEVLHARKGGPTLRLRKGRPWMFYKGDRPAPARFASIAFDGKEIVFEATGLDAKAAYRLGLSWWDYNTNQRRQSVRVVSADGKVSRTLLGPTLLPGWQGKRQPPEQRDLAIPPQAYASGTMRIVIAREGGFNAVISELWLWRKGPAPK